MSLSEVRQKTYPQKEIREARARGNSRKYLPPCWGCWENIQISWAAKLFKEQFPTVNCILERPQSLTYMIFT